MSGPDIALVVFIVAPLLAGFAAFRYVRRARRDAGGARPPFRRLLAGNALVLVFLLAVAALAGEIGLRFVRDSTDSLGYLRATERWFGRHYRVNRDKFRDDVEYDIGPVPEGKRRVSFVGDSFTAGHGVEVGDRFANRLRAARPGWDVHVLAQNGADTGAQLELLRDRIPAYKGGAYALDLVVLVYTPNDIGDIVPEVGQYAARLAARDDRGALAANSDLFDFLRFLWVRRTDPDVRDFFPSLARGYAYPETWYSQRSRLRALRKAVTDRGGRLAVVTFPFVGLMGESYPFREPHRQLGDFWGEEGVPHLDLTTVFAGHDPSGLVVSRFDGHPSEEAHAMAADAIGPFVDRVLAEPPRR